MPARCTTRRLITRAIVFLIAGAIVNVAVAWGFAAVAPRGQPVRVALQLTMSGDGTPQWWLATRQEAIGLTVQWDRSNLRKEDRIRQAGSVLFRTYYDLCGNGDGGSWEVPYPIRKADWSRLGFIDFAGRPVWILSEVVAGWPSRALWGCPTGYDRESGEPMHAFCIGLGEMRKYEHFDSREICLPLQPVWPGFAINTTLYAAILWLLLASAGLIRKRRRIKRGLCPACAYPVGANELCTECGANLPTRTQQTPGRAGG